VIDIALGDKNPLVLSALSELFERDRRFSLVVTANTALAHTHTRLHVACTGWLYDEADVTGCRIVATLQQHRAQPAGQSATFDLYFGKVGDRA